MAERAGALGESARSTSARGWRSDPIEVLLVEDDDGDAYLVGELLDEARDRLRLTRVRAIAEARVAVVNADCVLLDLQLPDAEALEGLRRMRGLAGETPVVVLTGLADEAMGEAAITAGAQDYLIKGEVDARSLIRTIHFAVHRRRAELMETALLEERLHALENARLERGLLPRPVLAEDSAITVTSRYQPGGARMLLGGDFYDVVADDRGTVRLVVGDVSGHGPDQAALGVELRMAWRAPVMAGLADPDVLDVMDRVLVNERHDIDLFATV
ncbi:MAG TPA: response regulator, partial [Micromonosporaceae bacterium]